MPSTGHPIFLLQIVHATDHSVVATIPGGGALEADLIDLCTRHIMAKGVGFFRGEAHVEADIRAGLAEAIMALKVQTTQIAS